MNRVIVVLLSVLALLLISPGRNRETRERLAWRLFIRNGKDGRAEVWGQSRPVDQQLRGYGEFGEPEYLYDVPYTDGREWLRDNGYLDGGK